MLEQDQHEERLIALEAENRLIVAAEEKENTLNRCLRAEREDAEQKVEEASLLKKWQEEHVARTKAVKQVKRFRPRIKNTVLCVT